MHRSSFTLIRQVTLPVRLAHCFTFMMILMLAGAQSFDVIGSARAQAPPDEQHAFDAAKDLGTVDAWDAFLKNYPTGFNADLARAYLKKVSDQGSTTAPSANSPTVAGGNEPAEELLCSDVPKLFSQTSDTAAKIIFINVSGERRKIQWIDFKGGTKDYATLEPGQTAALDTFLTHPWFAANASGDCTQVFRPGTGTTVARLERNGAPASRVERDDSAPVKKVYREKSSSKTYQTCRDIGQVYSNGVCVKPKSATTNAAKSCKELGLVLKNGKCVAYKQSDINRVKKQKKKGCPSGTYLNPLGQCQPNETGG